MRRLTLLALAVLVAALSVGGVALAQSPGSDPEGDTPGTPDVFHYYAMPNEEAETFVPAVGGPAPDDEETPPAVGDVVIFEDQLFALDPDTNGPTGDQVGTVNVICTFVGVDVEVFSADLLCDGVVSLPRGMITLHTKVSFAEDAAPEIVVPITGGSGAYADAGGRLVIHQLGDEDEGDAIYEFRLLHLALQP